MATKKDDFPKRTDERDRSLALDYFIIAPEFDVDYYLKIKM
jgi:hypothetical protein